MKDHAALHFSKERKNEVGTDLFGISETFETEAFFQADTLSYFCEAHRPCPQIRTQNWMLKHLNGRKGKVLFCSFEMQFHVCCPKE